MQLALKDSFYKIFFPIIGSCTILIFVNFGALTLIRFFEIISIVFVSSIVGAFFISLISYLYDIYELSLINKIKERFKGEEITPNSFRFQYKNITALFERTNNYRFNQSEFVFHVPRKYIPKNRRNEMEGIKPSIIQNEKCFRLSSWFYITENRLKRIEKLLDDISELNNK